MAGLSAVAAWQPNGRHVYVAQHAGPSARMLLYERNGLQHGGFDISVPGALHCTMAKLVHDNPEQTHLKSLKGPK